MLDNVHVSTISQLDDLEIVHLLHVANPLVRLTLWIDEQAPAL